MGDTNSQVVEILKENEYKLVELHNSERSRFVAKTFRGHGRDDCLRNAAHTYASLELLNREFANELDTPEVLSLKDCTVTMRFMSELPNARQFGFAELPLAEAFFRRCYDLPLKTEDLGSLESSVWITEKCLQLMKSGFPLRLGFKGDLYENLRVHNDSVLIADSETACLEPLGLSELSLYILISSRPINLFKPQRVDRIARPIAYDYLDNRQIHGLIDAAIEFEGAQMAHLPGPIGEFKLHRARKLLVELI